MLRFNCLLKSWDVFSPPHHFSKVGKLVGIYDQGGPAISYKWTGWVWEITGWSSRLQVNYWSFWRNLWNIPQITIEKTKDVNMKLVGLANTRISTDYARKSPWSLVGRQTPVPNCQFKWRSYTSRIRCFHPKSSWIGEVKPDVLKIVVTLHVQMSHCFR